MKRYQKKGNGEHIVKAFEMQKSEIKCWKMEAAYEGRLWGRVLQLAS